MLQIIIKKEIHNYQEFEGLRSKISVGGKENWANDVNNSKQSIEINIKTNKNKVNTYNKHKKESDKY